MANNNWQQFLIDQGIDISEHANDFNDLSTQNSDTRICALSEDGLIAVSGADALDFLQGQLTNDIKHISQAAQYTGYCTAKGRLLALFYAFTQNDVIYLQCPREIVPSIVKRLTMFVLRSKVRIEDVSDAWVSLGLTTTQASLTTTWPSATHAPQALLGGQLIRLPSVGNTQRARMLLPVADAILHWPSLHPQYRYSTPNHWEILEIQAATPQVYAATQEQFVPQMLNLDLLQAINFKKGCYTGQEIVARTHYLGKVKRRTWLAQLQLPPAAQQSQPKIGDQVLDQQQQEAGQIVRVATTGDQGNYWVLVECRHEAKQAGEIYWQGVALSWCDMPYVIET